MSKFELTGEQRDLVRSYAIHQDFKSLWAFIEDLIDKQGVPDGKTNDGATKSATKK